MDRRKFLSASTLVAGASLVGCAGSAAALAQTAEASPAAVPPAPTRMDRLAVAAKQGRMPIRFDGGTFSGPGYDWLRQQASEAHAFLLGEEHGIAENPMLAGQLFRDMVPSGYRNMAIEISPPLAAAVDRVVTQGPAATRAFLTAPETRVAFYGMKEEAAFLATVRSALPHGNQLFWGLDYEISADRYIIAELSARRKPAAATAAMDRLAAASSASWAKYDATPNPELIFSFSGDPKLAQDVRAAWPGIDADSSLLLDTLEQTLAINRYWLAKKGYESNLARSRFMRSNLLRYWRGRRDPDDRLFMKFGASHMVRGLSMTDIFDIGTLVQELVAERGGKSFHLMVLPGPGTQTANLDPTQFKYVPGNRDQYGEGMQLLDDAVIPGTFTLFDTAPLRPIASSYAGGVPLPLWRVIHGFDAVLVMTGSHPSSNL